MQLKRVVLAIGGLRVGGTEGQVVLLAKGLKERGIEVAVASLYEDGPYEVELHQAGIPIHLGGFPRLHRDGRRAVARAGPAMARFVSWLREWRPDLVHAFLYHSYVVTPPAARLSRVPVVVAGRRSMGTFKGGRRPLLWIERVATRMTDLIVANSHAIARETTRQEKLRADKIAVIHNGVPARFFEDHEPAEIPHEHALVVCVANFRTYKGHRFLLEAVRQLSARGLRFTLALAGEGSERPVLEAQATAAGVDVRFLGPRREVPALLAAADLVVLPSLEEGFSNSILEAMAAGRPIVATNVGGNAEALDGTGVLVAPGDAAALADGVGQLLGDPTRARALGLAARRRAAQEFSADVMVDRHVDVYRSLIA